MIPGPSAGMVSGASESIRSVWWGKGMVEVTSCFVMEKYSCERGFWLFFGMFLLLHRVDRALMVTKKHYEVLPAFLHSSNCCGHAKSRLLTAPEEAELPRARK